MVSTSDTKAAPAPGREPVTHPDLPPLPFISEGVAQEVIANGQAVDPGTGRMVSVGNLPESRRKEAIEAAQRRAKAEPRND